MLNLCFFLVPVFLYLGIAVQSVGVYLFALVIPLALTFQRARFKSIPFLPFGLFLLGLHAVFPVSSLIAKMWAKPGMSIEYAYAWPAKITKLFESRLSSSFLVCGLVLISVGIWNAKRKNSTLSRQKYSLRPLESYWKGLIFSTFAFGCYFVFQHFIGFDFRSPGFVLKEEHQMAGGRFRIFGFYGHPLTLASVALAYFAYLWSLLWHQMEAKKTLPKETTSADVVSLISKFPVNPILLGTAAALQFAFVIMSGGRVAALLASLLFIAIPVASIGTSKPRLLGFVLVGGGMFAALLVNGTGLLQRIAESVKLFSGQSADNRITFWKVHWQMFLDAPWFGQGSLWLDRGLRTAYYDALGYGALPEKFEAHNIFLEILASAGAVGMMIVCALTLVLALYLHKLLRGVLWGDFQRRALFFAFVANLLHGFTQNTFFDSTLTYIYLGMLLTTLLHVTEVES